MKFLIGALIFVVSVILIIALTFIILAFLGTLIELWMVGAK